MGILMRMLLVPFTNETHISKTSCDSAKLFFDAVFGISILHIPRSRLIFKTAKYVLDCVLILGYI